MPQPFADQHSLFRAYDIRGEAQYFNSEFLYALSEAFVRLFKTHNSQVQTELITQNERLSAKDTFEPNYKSKIPTVVIGYDVRHGSDSIAKALATVLQQQGLQVVSLGLITTPMMAFWSEQYEGHGIMVTASHSAKGILGIKWLVAHSSPSADSIQALYQDMLDANHKQPQYHNTDTDTKSSNIAVINLPTQAVAAPYIQAIEEVFTAIYPKHNVSVINNRRLIKKLDLTVVIDCLNGATSRIVRPLFAQFCREVIILNDSPDGSFPTGNPDPTEPNRLAELQQTVIIHAADIGLAFDGDGDRLMIVDNSGKVVTADHLLYLLAKVAITECPKEQKSNVDDISISANTEQDKLSTEQAPQVLFDIKCSHHLPILLSKLGATPILSKTGSSLMRRQLRANKSQAIFAGELSGHFIFNDGYFTVYDDAMYAGLRLLNWLAYTAAAPIEDASMLAVDLWGEPKKTPYQLTDITKYLPLLVSTADHYIPLSNSDFNGCSVVDHLTELCRHLQHSSGEPAAPPPLSCNCFNTGYIATGQAYDLIPAGTRLSSIDGVRLDFTRGFGVLRESNTSNALTVRFAGDSMNDLREVQARFVALCQLFDKRLAQQISAIPLE